MKTKYRQFFLFALLYGSYPMSVMFSHTVLLETTLGACFCFLLRQASSGKNGVPRFGGTRFTFFVYSPAPIAGRIASSSASCRVISFGLMTSGQSGELWYREPRRLDTHTRVFFSASAALCAASDVPESYPASYPSLEPSSCPAA